MSNYNTCAECNKEFGGRKKKYCSKECGDEVRRRRNRERFRLENGLYEKYGDTKDCKMCGVKIEGGDITSIYCSRKCNQTYQDRANGHRPIEEFYSIIGEQKQQRLEALGLEKSRKALLNSIRSIVAKEIKIQKEQEKIEALTRECEECGEVFYNLLPQCKTCSPKCSKRRERRMNKLYASKRINEHNLVDKDISLRKLYKRDKGVCYLCGNMCDKKDVSITDEGYYIVGPTYPSIDHVEPLSKGGKHAWTNVKLAHHYCNTLKGDSI